MGSFGLCVCKCIVFVFLVDDRIHSLCHVFVGMLFIYVCTCVCVCTGSSGLLLM